MSCSTWGQTFTGAIPIIPPQGIELYNGKAILYSTGDFIDDYMVDKDERNDLSFLFLIAAEKNLHHTHHHVSDPDRGLGSQARQ